MLVDIIFFFFYLEISFKFYEIILKILGFVVIVMYDDFIYYSCY